MPQKDWSEYYKNREKKPVSKLVEIFLHYVIKKERAFDLGVVSLKESLYLLNKGFKTVLAIDKSPLIKEFTIKLNKNNLIVQNLANLKVILLDEIQKDRHKTDGTPKHWYIFNIIAQK